MVRAANEKSAGFYFVLFLCFLLGAVCIYHDLGVIAFVLAVFVGIFGFGLREKFSNETTASAYSVFNEDGRAIVGGFTSSQFERQLRGSVASQMASGAGGNPDASAASGPIARARTEGPARRTNVALSDAERTARRRAAAEAAERRFQAAKEE